MCITLFQAAGVWYIRGRFSNHLEDHQICNYLNLVPRMVGSYETRHGYNYVEGRWVSIRANVTVPNPQIPGELLYHYPGNFRMPLFVLYTDYEYSALLFACVEGSDVNNPVSQQYLWLISRYPFGFPPALRSRLIRLAKSFRIPTRYLERVPQKCCPRY